MHVLYINRSRIWWCLRQWLWIGAALTTCVVRCLWMKWWVLQDFFCRRHFLMFRYLLTNSPSCIIHQSNRHWTGIAPIALDWRSYGYSCRKGIFCSDGKCQLCRFFFSRTLLTHCCCFLIHQSMQNLMRIALIALDGHSFENSCRKANFGWTGECFLLYCRRCFLLFRYLLTNSTVCYIHQSNCHSMRIAMVSLDGRSYGGSCRKAIFGL